MVTDFQNVYESRLKCTLTDQPFGTQMFPDLFILVQIACFVSVVVVIIFLALSKLFPRKMSSNRPHNLLYHAKYI
jgi:hypothetical protein